MESTVSAPPTPRRGPPRGPIDQQGPRPPFRPRLRGTCCRHQGAKSQVTTYFDSPAKINPPSRRIQRETPRVDHLPFMDSAEAGAETGAFPQTFGHVRASSLAARSASKTSQMRPLRHQASAVEQKNVGMLRVLPAHEPQTLALLVKSSFCPAWIQ